MGIGFFVGMMVMIFYGIPVFISMLVGALAGAPGIVTAQALAVTVRLLGVVKMRSIPPSSGERVPLIGKLKLLKLIVPILTALVYSLYTVIFAVTAG